MADDMVDATNLTKAPLGLCAYADDFDLEGGVPASPGAIERITLRPGESRPVPAKFMATAGAKSLMEAGSLSNEDPETARNRLDAAADATTEAANQQAAEITRRAQEQADSIVGEAMARAASLTQDEDAEDEDAATLADLEASGV